MMSKSQERIANKGNGKQMTLLKPNTMHGKTFAAKIEDILVPNDETFIKLKTSSYLTSLPGFSEHKLDLGLLKNMLKARKQAMAINLHQQHLQRQQ